MLPAVAFILSGKEGQHRIHIDDVTEFIFFKNANILAYATVLCRNVIYRMHIRWSFTRVRALNSRFSNIAGLLAKLFHYLHELAASTFDLGFI